MDELVFDEARSAVVSSTLRAFAADGRPTAEVERLLVHVARTASRQDLVDVAYDLAAQVLSPTVWDRLAEEPWLAAELDAAADANPPVEVRLVITGATPEQARRLLDQPVEVLGDAFSLVGDVGEAHLREAGAVRCPRGVGPDDMDEEPGSRPPLRRSRRARRRDDPVRSRGRRPGGPRAAARPPATASRRATAGPRGSRPACRPGGHGATGSRSRDGPHVGSAHRGGARTVTT